MRKSHPRKYLITFSLNKYPFHNPGFYYPFSMLTSLDETISSIDETVFYSMELVSIK